MANKKKQYEDYDVEEQKDNFEQLLSPVHWARQDKIDEMLFKYWEAQLMTKKQYEKIKSKVYKKRRD